MAIATRSSLDHSTPATRQDGFTVEASPNDRLISAMAGLPLEEVKRRRAEHHRPYVARVGGKPAAYGWVASRRASIGELGIEIELPVGHRYLWDFATLPSFWGRGIYPRLLEEIVRIEGVRSHRFWITHAPENLPSATGIQRAAFVPVADLSLDRRGTAALKPVGDEALADVARGLLGVPVTIDELDPCWRCGGCACYRSERHGGGCGCAVTPAE